MKLPKPLFARAYASVAVLLGKGDGTFQAAVDYGSGPSPVSLAVSDFNGDGKLDVAVAKALHGRVGAAEHLRVRRHWPRHCPRPFYCHRLLAVPVHRFRPGIRHEPDLNELAARARDVGDEQQSTGSHRAAKSP